MVYYVQNRRFNELRLDDGRFYGENGFAGEHHRSLGNGIHVARESQVFKVSEKTLVEQVKPAKISDFLFAERKTEDIIHGLLQPCGDGIGDEFFSAEEHVKHGDFVRFTLEVIPVHHREFVKVREKS